MQLKIINFFHKRINGINKPYNIVFGIKTTRSNESIFIITINKTTYHYYLKYRISILNLNICVIKYNIL